MALIYSETIGDTNTFLTNLATGYKLQKPVADFIAPSFQVKLEDGKYVEYNKTVWRIFDDKIIGSEEAKEIQYDVDEASYSCEEYGMAKFVRDKMKKNAVNPIKYDTDAMKFLKQFHALAREYRLVQIAGNTAIVTNTSSPATKWSASGGTPVSDILDAMASVHTAVGGEYIPNRILIPIEAALNMVQTDEWKEYFKYTDTGNKNLFNVVSGLKQLGLNPMLTGVSGLSEEKGSASDPSSEQLWEEKVLLFYCEPKPTLESRTFMYSPYVAQNKIFSTRRPRRRGIYHDIYSDIDELLVDSDCAYLFTDVL